MNDLIQCSCCHELKTDCKEMGHGYKSLLCFDCFYMFEKLNFIKCTERFNEDLKV